MKKRFLPQILFIVFAFTVILTGQVFAYQPEGLSVQVSPGLDGYCKEDAWFPVRLIVENTGSAITGEIQITGNRPGDMASTYASPFSAPTGSRKSNTILVFAGDFFTELKANVVVNGQTIVSVPFRINCLPPQDQLFGVLAAQTSPYNVLIDLDPPNGSASVAQLSLDDLSRNPHALEPLDALLISGVDTSSLSPDQLSGISGWVATGGQLLLVGGPNWSLTLPTFSHLLPLIPSGTTRLPSLEDFAANFGDLNTLNSEGLVTTGTLADGAEVLAQEKDIPVLIRRSYGGGSVSVLALDPALSPLRNWGEINEVYRLAFSTQQSSTGWISGFVSWDFAREAVSIIPGLALPPFALICGLLFIYVMVIGPVNYWLLRRWNRREFAWISIPLLVVVFTVMTYAVGRNSRGNRPIVNRMSIIQIWPDADQARVDSLVGIFSPDRSSYQVNIGPGYIPYTLPDDFSSGPDSFDFIQTSSSTSIPSVQIEVGGIDSFGVQGYIATPQITSDLKIDLASPNPNLSGGITMPPNLDLVDAVLLAPGATLRLGSLKAGEHVEVGLSFQDTQANQFNNPPSPRGYPTLNLVEDIIGVGYYAGFNDPETAARVALLNALIDPYGQPIDRGPGVFLVGWSNSPIVPVELESSIFDPRDLTAFIISLPYRVELSSNNPVTIPPSLFRWEAFDNYPPRPNGPYDVYLEPGGEIRMKYNPTVSFKFSEISSLTLQLEGDQSLPSPPSISLWNFTNEAWEEISQLNWGSYKIPDPHVFTTDEGEIRARVVNTQNQLGIYIERLDFTLSVIP